MPLSIEASNVEWVRQGDDDPHALGLSVYINGVQHYALAFEVVGDTQDPHPEMTSEMSDWYESITRETSPDGARKTIEIDGHPGRWVIIICP